MRNIGGWLAPINYNYVKHYWRLLLQIFEMWAAGYSFFLLNNIFASHWGFQKSSSRPSWRKKQTDSNKSNAEKFLNEVKEGLEFS